MKVEILGPGCARCQTLVSNAKAAVDELELPCDVVKVTDINEIARRGILMTPALVIDGNLRSVGRVPSIQEIRDLLAKA